MKKLIALALFVVSVLSISAQVNIYKPEADAEEDIANAVEVASKSGKHIFLQIGGNWCPWCVKFHNFLEANEELTSYVKANYEVVKVNYDRKENQNEIWETLGFPQRFGFPVFVVLYQINFILPH